MVQKTSATRYFCTQENQNKTMLNNCFLEKLAQAYSCDGVITARVSIQCYNQPEKQENNTSATEYVN